MISCQRFVFLLDGVYSSSLWNNFVAKTDTHSNGLSYRESFIVRIQVSSQNPRGRLWKLTSKASGNREFLVIVATISLSSLPFCLLLFLSCVSFILLALCRPTFSAHMARHSSCSASPCPSFMSPSSLSTDRDR